MIRCLLLFSFLVVLLLFSCKSEMEENAMDRITSNVRAYFFLSDSVDLSIQVIDTLSTKDLNEMLDQVNKNLNLIDRDLDTLSAMIDEQAYAAMYVQLELDKKSLLNRSPLEDSLQRTSIRKLEYQLKQAQLKEKKEVFKQTNRLLLHLKRSIENEIAGYSISVRYSFNNEILDFELLLDKHYVIVD